MKVIVEIIETSEDLKKDIVERIYYLLKDNDNLELDRGETNDNGDLC